MIWNGDRDIVSLGKEIPMMRYSIFRKGDTYVEIVRMCIV